MSFISKWPFLLTIKVNTDNNVQWVAWKPFSQQKSRNVFLNISNNNFMSSPLSSNLVSSAPSHHQQTIFPLTPQGGRNRSQKRMSSSSHCKSTSFPATLPCNPMAMYMLIASQFVFSTHISLTWKLYAQLYNDLFHCIPQIQPGQFQPLKSVFFSVPHLSKWHHHSIIAKTRNLGVRSTSSLFLSHLAYKSSVIFWLYFQNIHVQWPSGLLVRMLFRTPACHVEVSWFDLVFRDGSTFANQ